MTTNSLPSYFDAAQTLQQSSVAISPAEMHGLLVGMISGGINVNDQSWHGALFDYTNEGMGWPQTALSIAQASFDLSKTELMGSGMEITLLLPEDEEATLMEVADSVAEWVNHFISGLGLASNSLSKLSSDAKEALSDLEEIAKLGIDEDDDMEEQALLLEQVIEHVKACVLTVHAELGQKPSQDAEKPTLH
ncbi:YecA family protein [Vibrio sp. WXL103]|uniref:YecA/YgfB family protein n=1 Tax=unclassified Vibrio TaxID=2614977 RepID=UPI003EC86885